jgi:putative ABC transport system permease protein
MLWRLLRRDVTRNRVITAALFAVVTLAALLVSTALAIMLTLLSSTDTLFEQAATPDFVQMHTEEVDPELVNSFARSTGLVEDWQSVDLLNVDGAWIHLGNNPLSEAASISENSFVVQNPRFDFLLDTSGAAIEVSDGEIAVPLLHRQTYGLELGQQVRVARGDFAADFTIVDFLRDSQMNPALITSKRFLVSPADWDRLADHFEDQEHLTEFRLAHRFDLGAFERLYEASALPQTGTAITLPLLRLLNALTDGLVAAVLMLLSGLLVVIAALCLRLTLIATIEQDYREIGFLKAIGLPHRDIRRLYLTKYAALAVVAAALGYGLSTILSRVFTANITLYMGQPPTSAWRLVAPALGAAAVGLAVIGFCSLVLRRFRRISAVQAIREGVGAEPGRAGRRLRLTRPHLGNLHVFLGLRAVAQRPGSYTVLGVVFVLAAFLMVLPLALVGTLRSPDFITYMGAGHSDIRIDIPATEDNAGLTRAIARDLHENPAVTASNTLVTAAYETDDAAGERQHIRIENGDFAVFPLAYEIGSAPVGPGDLALSSLNAQNLGVAVGDSLTVYTGAQPHRVTVTGIYQDVTNGGQTAKGHLPYEPGTVIRSVVNAAFAPGTSVADEIAQLQRRYPGLKVTSIDDYMRQSLAGLTGQIAAAGVLAVVLAIAISALITALFLRLLIAQEASQIAILRALGFARRAVWGQFATRIGVILILGAVIGFGAAWLLGPLLAGAVVPGVSSLTLVFDAWLWLVCPLALLIGVGLPLWGSAQAIGHAGRTTSPTYA